MRALILLAAVSLLAWAAYAARQDRRACLRGHNESCWVPSGRGIRTSTCFRCDEYAPQP